MWRSFSWRDHVLALQAGLLAPVLSLLLRVTSMQYCQRLLLSLRATTPGASKTPLEPAALQRLAGVINFGCRRYALFSPACLARSLLQQHLLARRGIDVCLCLGSRLEQGAFTAHAWVEHQGVVLGEAEHPGGLYVPFDALRQV